MGFDAADSERKVAKTENDEKLKALLAVQDSEEQRDLQGIKDADKLKDKADRRIEEDEARVAGVEAAENESLSSRSKSLHKDAQKLKGPEKDTLEAESTLYRSWGRDSNKESRAAKKHNGRGMVTNHQK